jgi:hypothetical protein
MKAGITTITLRRQFPVIQCLFLMVEEGEKKIGFDIHFFQITARRFLLYTGNELL